MITTIPLIPILIIMIMQSLTLIIQIIQSHLILLKRVIMKDILALVSLNKHSLRVQRLLVLI